jgi:hypothetical protein
VVEIDGSPTEGAQWLILLFFSYARADRRGAETGRISAYGRGENSIEEFYRRLCNRVANLTGMYERDVGFFDDRHLELGAPWPARLTDALRSAHVMVALFSPVYFTRQACGREFQIFRLRHKVLEERLGRAPDYRVLPVLWGRPDVTSESVPECCRDYIQALQLTPPDMPQSYAKYGLMRMLELKWFESDSNAVCHGIADRIYALMKGEILPGLDDHNFSSVESAFHEAQATRLSRPIDRMKREMRVYYLVPTRSEWSKETGANNSNFADQPEKARLFADAPGATVGSATEEGVAMVKPDIGVVHKELPNNLALDLKETNDSLTTPLVVFDRRSLEVPTLRAAATSYAESNFENTGFVTAAGHEVPNSVIETAYGAKIGALPKLHAWNVPAGRAEYVRNVASVVSELEMQLVRRQIDKRNCSGEAIPNLSAQAFF